MARFYGEVGYGESVEDPEGSGIFKDVITEITYRGDIVQESRRLEPGESLNDDIAVGTNISIVADAHAIAHYTAIKYVRQSGELWSVSSVQVKAPRLILTLGRLYNGPEA